MRISTGQIWNSALSNLMQAQIRQDQANQQVSSQKIADDLGGYGRSSEVITAYQSSLSRIDGYTEVSKSVLDRLDSQNIALERAGEGIATAKDALMDAIASDNIDTLMSTLQTSYMAFADGLNYKHQGSYLFGGGQEAGAPLTAQSLNDLAATPAAGTFANGSVKKSSKIDGTTTLQTGMLASELGAETVAIFRELKAYADDPANQPFTGKLSTEKQTFLQGMVERLGGAYDKMVDATAFNGSMQNRVDNTLTSLQSQSNSLKGLVADKTEVNMAEAYTRLEQAELAVNASAQVVANLRSSSLLELLR